MTTRSHIIELDEPVAAALKERADELGMTVADLLAELVREVTVHPKQITELDRQWAAVETGQPTVPNDRVVRWLETWGSPAFKPWRSE